MYAAHEDSVEETRRWGRDRVWGVFSCFVRVVVGSLRDHTAHMNSLVFQTALSSCDCSLTAVSADARLCEQLLPATATLQDLTHCPERSASLAAFFEFLSLQTRQEKGAAIR